MNCDEKAVFSNTRTAYTTVESLGDPYLKPYLCDKHQALHLGHEPIRRSYKTWQGACDAARFIHARQRDPRRIRIWKNGGRWTISWSPVVRRTLNLDEARRRLGLAGTAEGAAEAEAA